MAVLATIHPTLQDFASRTDPDGKIAAIVELLTQDTSILEDMSWVEGNLPTGHRTTVRTGLPEPTWRKLYGGVQPTKSTTAQITDNTGMLEDYAEVDKALADLNGNTNEFRLSENRAHITGFAHKLTRTIIYGNEGTEPEAFTGLAPRYNSLTAGNADNIIDAGGTGTDNASIWLIGWGPNSVHGIIPKGSNAGLQMTDKGQVTIENVDGNGGRMEAYRTHYRQDAGLTVRDWRYIVRIANIDKSLLIGDATTGANLLNFMDDALERLPTGTEGSTNLVWYMPRHVRAFLRKQMKNAVKNSTLTMEQVQGRYIPTYDGIPIKRLDVLGADEARVV
jgi:hypothetical protein